VLRRALDRRDGLGVRVRVEVSKVVVLGAGNMGSQVAALLAPTGVDVALLDMVVPGEADRSVLARRALEALKKLKPSALRLPEDLALIRIGNFEDDWHELAQADWIFEAVVEDEDVKRRLLSRVASVAKSTAILSTNTSGLPIRALSSHLGHDFRKRFLGTHFFNPPRYLRLLETIPGPDTEESVLQRIEHFCDVVAGKAIVRCKDTPNFIANRIGSYSLGVALRAMVELDLTVEEVDILTGPAIGRAKSATFRTVDIAGVDVCYKVLSHLFDAVPEDSERDVFKAPQFMKTMVEREWLGDKREGGFYRKRGRDISALDWKTLSYRERAKVSIPSVEAALRNPDVGGRIQQILAGNDKAARFLWQVLASTCLYAASKIPEVADDPVSIDRAMEWGYGWGMGPFRLLDALGVDALAERAKGEGRTIPPLIGALLSSGRKGFYGISEGKKTVFGPGGAHEVSDRPGTIDVAHLKERGGLRKKNAGASLVDLRDGCALVEFHTKMNALGADAVHMLEAGVKEARANFDAVVVWGQGEQFSVGANLMLVLLAAQEGEYDELDLMIRQFQRANMALKGSNVPVVVAPFGLTLGGGCEIALHGARVRASAETYMGLVEVGVGLVPAGGGTKEMALRALERCAGVEGADPFPFLKRAFETIAFAKVSTSGAEALRMFLRPADSLSPNPDRLLSDAKQAALDLARAGYRPCRPRLAVPALGRPALATFKMGIHNALRGGRASEHDALVATKVATILCGGDKEPGTTTEQALLDLERESFLSLLGTRKTQERIQHMLREGKPLRN